ncbi:DUF3667 domain-containing protein [Hymenobacter sp. J193]|uniref:DUF3667 domain-containing protein n=1 Tax=Hymenobacter sp. J193 TaxID=2898429 RepID=UPI002150C23E|nr:DUF3667 domain-containing protein [Hymenobacter sp. J193]MCR5889245.1 DUF3667 domain-containing protein [Hymenobacter sp. J193]
MHATSASSPATAALIEPAPHACLNCGTTLHDEFCAHCGQAASTHRRITLGHWLHDIPHSIWHVDKGLPYTLQQMLRRPGPTLQRYLAGQRAPFFRPLSYLLIITGLITFLYVVLHLRPYNTHDPSIPAALRIAQERFIGFFSKYINWFAVALLPLTSAVVRLFLRRGGFNYAESITVATFVTGTSHFLTLLVLPVLYLLNGTRSGQMLMMSVTFLTLAYQSWAYGSLLQGTGLSAVGRYLRGWAAAMGGYLITLTIATFIMIMLNREQIQAFIKHKTQHSAQPVIPR